MKLTSRTLKALIGPDFIVHVVDPADTTDAPDGSSFKAVLSESYIPLAGTKSGFPVNGDISIIGDADVFLKQVGLAIENYMYWSGDSAVAIWSKDAVTSDSYGVQFSPPAILFQRNFLPVGEFDSDENFGIAQTTPSAEYRINLFRALSTRGVQNLWVGRAGNNTSTGVQNTCVGLRAGEALTTGSENVMIGQVCGVLITTGSRNTLFGKETAPVMTFGNDNLFAGYRSGFTLTTGNENTLIGRSSGSGITTASRNTFIGYLTGFTGATQRTKSGAIGWSAKVDKDNAFCIGGAFGGGDFMLLGIGIDQPTAWIDLPSTTNAASIRMRSGLAPITPNSGDVWHDSTSNAIAKHVAGLSQFDIGTIFTQVADKTVANTVVATSLFSSLTQIPANYLTIGKTFRIRMNGYIGTTGTPTITATLRIGGVNILSGVNAPNSVLSTPEQFSVDILFTVRSIGVGGSVIGQGTVNWHDSNGPNSNFDGVNIVSTGAVVINTTIANNIDVLLTWGAASASNSVTITNATIEVIK
jgi:hypothetical protein